MHVMRRGLRAGARSVLGPLRTHVMRKGLRAGARPVLGPLRTHVMRRGLRAGARPVLGPLRMSGAAPYPGSLALACAGAPWAVTVVIGRPSVLSLLGRSARSQRETRTGSVEMMISS